MWMFATFICIAILLFFHVKKQRRSIAMVWHQAGAPEVDAVSAAFISNYIQSDFHRRFDFVVFYRLRHPNHRLLCSIESIAFKLFSLFISIDGNLRLDLSSAVEKRYQVGLKCVEIGILWARWAHEASTKLIFSELSMKQNIQFPAWNWLWEMDMSWFSVLELFTRIIMSLMVIRDPINHNKNVLQAIVNIKITYLKGQNSHLSPQNVFYEPERLNHTLSLT